MVAFIKRMIKDKYKSTFVYSFVAICFMELYVALFPSLNKMSSQLNEIIRTMPSGLFKAFNIEPSSFSFGNIESLLASKHFSMVWPIMAIVLAISIANYLIVNEIDKGTAESLMSLPVKRSKIFISRYYGGIILLLIFNILSIFCIFPLASLHNVDFIWQNNITLFFGSFIFTWACYSIALFISTIFSEKGKANMTYGGIILVSYFINILASLKDNLSNLKYFSIFNYYNSETLLIKNTYPNYFLLAFSFLIIIFSFLAFYRFITRDISN